MLDNQELKKLLGQSESEYAKFLMHNDVEAFAEAGELLWECFKLYITRITNKKTDNLNDLRKAASQLGEEYNLLFDRCYHFHCWYEGAVPNDFEAEKQLYLKTSQSLEKTMRNKGKIRRTKRPELEIV